MIQHDDMTILLHDMYLNWFRHSMTGPIPVKSSVATLENTIENNAVFASMLVLQILGM